MAKDTLWFPHDYNSRADEKTAALIADYGMEGYGLYMVLLEMLHEEDSAKIEYSDQKIKRICRPLKLSFEKSKIMIEAMINDFELFIIEDNFFYSDRVLRNKVDREKIRQKRINAGKIGGEANALRFEANALKIEANGKQIEANRSTGHNNTIQDSKEQKRLEKEKLFMSNEKKFYETLKEFLPEFGKELCRTFYDYWREPNKSRTKMRWETEKTWDLNLRLKTFQRNDKNFAKKESAQNADDEILRKAGL